MYRPDRVSWAARREPVLNTQSAQDLRAVILKALALDGKNDSKAQEDSGATLATYQRDNEDSQDTPDLLVTADGPTEVVARVGPAASSTMASWPGCGQRWTPAPLPTGGTRTSGGRWPGSRS